MSLEYSGFVNTESVVDLESIIESGQTFLWQKENGEMFDGTGGTYVSARNEGDLIRSIRIRQENEDSIYWESNLNDTGDYISDVLGLNHQIEEIRDRIISCDTSGVMEKAVYAYPGLRVVNEPVFPTTISFICSTQMRVERIHQMVTSLTNQFGSDSHIDGLNAFPTPRQLSVATEDQLKDLKLGYRASYVVDTVDKIVNGEFEFNNADNMARENLENLTGVGTKVADCVLLYASSSNDVVPVDTWIDKAVKEYYPQLEGDSRSETARNFEEVFGDDAGYAQMYLFHYMRNQ